MALRLGDFDYPLEAERIAQAPLPDRGASRLMHLRRRDGCLFHRRFGDIQRLLTPGDVLVLNDTRVVPARLSARRATGGRIDGLFCRELAPGRWEVLLRGAGRCREGERLMAAADPPVAIELQRSLGEGRYEVAVSPPAPAAELLERIGAAPLPPYIRRPGTLADREDRRRYQTVYAEQPGAIAAPTAGLHFTEDLLARLPAEGVQIVRVTLHVGLGTFAPVTGEDLSAHRMHREWYDLPAETAAAVAAARREGRRVVAVGTTSVRVLETAARAGEPVGARSGWTDLFIYPPADFRVVGALVTNFHLPRSTLLMLTAAFCDPGGTGGVPVILGAYAEARRLKYRFYSYGDAMFIE